MIREELIEAALSKAGKRFYTIISREAVADVVDIVLDEAAKAAAGTCSECGGAEWLWAHENDGAGSLLDDTKYSCRLNAYHETCKAIAAIRALNGE